MVYTPPHVAACIHRTENKGQHERIVDKESDSMHRWQSMGKE